MNIREDFDRIALLPQDGWHHNRHYHPFLLRRVPPRCREALDFGCGTGAFTRLLAERSGRVTAVDLSPQMIRLAEERSIPHRNIDYQTADILTWTWPADRFDCIAGIATLHHLPPEEILSRCAAALAAGGVLLVLDLYRASSIADHLAGLAAVPVHAALRLFHTGRLRQTRAVREAWAQHGKHEQYPTLAEVREICRKALPGAEIRRHLLWRYSIVWKKPAGRRSGIGRG
jgi:SAM-dependent methyltransferase